MSLDAAWHQKHKMPKNPTLEERIAWHLEHARACDCRPIPEKLRELMESRRRKRPPRG